MLKSIPIKNIIEYFYNAFDLYRISLDVIVCFYLLSFYIGFCIL